MTVLKIALLLAVTLVTQMTWAADLVLVTDRAKDRLDSALTQFTAQTGLTVEVVFGTYPELKAKLEAGHQADLLIWKDVLTTVQATQSGLFQAMDDANKASDIDPTMRDSQGLWTALNYRVRTLVFNPDEIDSKSLPTYQSVAEPGRVALCVRNAKDYMPAMVAWLIERHGEEKALEILKGWKANLSTNFTSSDTDSMKQIEAGKCSAAIANHYYLARLKYADDRFPVDISFVDQFEGGAHTNGLTAGISKNSKRPEQANQLLSFLLSPAGQKALVEKPSFEYPALRSVGPEKVVENFGPVKLSDISWSSFGRHFAKASELLDQVGWAK